jgi:hypothetical protein
MLCKSLKKEIRWVWANLYDCEKVPHYLGAIKTVALKYSECHGTDLTGRKTYAAAAQYDWSRRRENMHSAYNRRLYKAMPIESKYLQRKPYSINFQTASKRSRSSHRHICPR